MKYVLKSKRGNYLACKNGKFVLVTTLDNALTYEDTYKLENIKNNCIPKTLRKFGPYKVVCVDSKIQESTHTATEDKIQYDLKANNINEIKNSVMNLKRNLVKIRNNQEMLSQELSRVDTIQSDLLHYIESHKFSAAEGYQLCKYIQAVRDERRIIKNQLYLSQLFHSKEYSLFINRDSESDFGECEDHYHPRILTDLFERNANRKRTI